MGVESKIRPLSKNKKREGHGENRQRFGNSTGWEILAGSSARPPGTFGEVQGSSEDQRRELPHAVAGGRHAALHDLRGQSRARLSPSAGQARGAAAPTPARPGPRAHRGRSLQAAGG